MFISFRMTWRGVVNVLILVYLVSLLYLGMNRWDQLSSDWNRTFGANMPNASAMRDGLDHARSYLPSVADEYMEKAEADAKNSRSLADVLRGTLRSLGLSDTQPQGLPYGMNENLESPYDHLAD